MVFLRSMLRLLVTANAVLVSLMMEAIFSSEPSVLTRATRHNIQKYVILHSRRREILQFYIELTVWAA
jgi:hypothetical protein